MTFKKALLFFLGIFILVPVRAQREIRDVELRVEPMYVSPNDDDIQDMLFLYPIFSSNANVTSWRMLINTGKGKKIQRLEGAGLPALIKWDGITRKGSVVSPGAYTATLQARGIGFNVISHAQAFYVDNLPPAVSLSVSTNVLDQSVLDNQVITFTPHVEDDSPIDRWQLQILNQTSKSCVSVEIPHKTSTS
jgi:hypothetical protein